MSETSVLLPWLWLCKCHNEGGKLGALGSVCGFRLMQGEFPSHWSCRSPICTADPETHYTQSLQPRTRQPDSKADGAAPGEGRYIYFIFCRVCKRHIAEQVKDSISSHWPKQNFLVNQCLMFDWSNSRPTCILAGPMFFTGGGRQRSLVTNMWPITKAELTRLCIVTLTSNSPGLGQTG